MKCSENQIECLKYTLKGLDESNENSDGIAFGWLHKDNEWEYKFNFVHFIQRYIIIKFKEEVSFYSTSDI